MSDYYFKGAVKSKHNAFTLKEASDHLIEKDGNSPYALFLLLTACEELEKAIFCLMVYHKYMTNDQINLVFKWHHSKIFLYEIIFDTLILKNDKFYILDKPLKNLDLRKIIKINKSFCENYKKYRESLLYVEKTDGGWHYPKNMSNYKFVDKFEKMTKRFFGLAGFLKLLGDYTLTGNIGNFELFERRPKEKPIVREIYFSGDGRLNLEQELFGIFQLNNRMSRYLTGRRS